MEDKKEAVTGASSSGPDGDPAEPLPDQDTRLIMTVRNRINRPPGWIYSCFFCSKTFNNPQALGGHQNTHRRERELQMREYDVKRKGRLRDRPARVRPERKLAPRHEPLFKPRYNSGLAPRSGALFGQMVMNGAPVCVPPPGYPPIFAYGPPVPHFPYGPNHGLAPRFEGSPLQYGPSLRLQNEIEDSSAVIQPPPRHQLVTRNFLDKSHPEQEEKMVMHQPQQHPPVNTTVDNGIQRQKDNRSEATLASMAQEAKNKILAIAEIHGEVNAQLDLNLKL